MRIIEAKALRSGWFMLLAHQLLHVSTCCESFFLLQESYVRRLKQEKPPCEPNSTPGRLWYSCQVWYWTWNSNIGLLLSSASERSSWVYPLYLHKEEMCLLKSALTDDFFLGDKFIRVLWINRWMRLKICTLCILSKWKLIYLSAPL